MRWATPPGRGQREPVLRRLDRVAGELNPLLLLVAVMLAFLNISCYAALTIHLHYQARLLAAPSPAAAPASAPSAAPLSRAAVSRLPPS